MKSEIVKNRRLFGGQKIFSRRIKKTRDLKVDILNQFAPAANSNNTYKLLLLLLFLRFDVYFRKQAGFYTVCETVVTRCRKGIFGEKVVAGTRP